MGVEKGPNVIIGYDGGEIILMTPSFLRSILGTRKNSQHNEKERLHCKVSPKKRGVCPYTSHFRVVSARTPSVSPVGRTTSTQGCDW